MTHPRILEHAKRRVPDGKTGYQTSAQASRRDDGLGPIIPPRDHNET